MYPHPAPGGWPFPVYRPTPYQPPVKPLEDALL